MDVLIFDMQTPESQYRGSYVRMVRDGRRYAARFIWRLSFWQM